jgi:hypothetical protein
MVLAEGFAAEPFAAEAAAVGGVAAGMVTADPAGDGRPWVGSGPAIEETRAEHKIGPTQLIA